jgi:hypothetical protein
MNPKKLLSAPEWAPVIEQLVAEMPGAGPNEAKTAALHAICDALGAASADQPLTPDVAMTRAVFDDLYERGIDYLCVLPVL